MCLVSIVCLQWQIRWNEDCTKPLAIERILKSSVTFPVLDAFGKKSLNQKSILKRNKQRVMTMPISSQTTFEAQKSRADATFYAHKGLSFSPSLSLCVPPCIRKASWNWKKVCWSLLRYFHRGISWSLWANASRVELFTCLIRNFFLLPNTGQKRCTDLENAEIRNVSQLNWCRVYHRVLQVTTDALD